MKSMKLTVNTPVGARSRVGAMRSRRPLLIKAVATENDVRSVSSAAASTSASRTQWDLPEGEVLHSLPEHQAWTYGGITAMLGLSYLGFRSAEGPLETAECAAAVVAAYYLSDLGSGVYHWIVDNWGDANTPVLGSQIAAFQGHHQKPWTITQRQFANNVYKVFKPATPFAGFFLLASFWTPSAFEAFMGSFLFLVCMSQQFHAWSHMKKSELPEPIVWAQDSGLLISRKAHGAHHKAPFDCNYCIVSGFWNPILDRSGFFKVLEKVSHTVSGVKPRSWDLPEDWHEQEQAALAAKAEDN